MNRLFHFSLALSIGILASTPPVFAAAPTAPSPYFGRWKIAEDKPHYTAKGREYKTFDIAPCGSNNQNGPQKHSQDFCGVSVSDTGKCGATLFRFLGKNATTEHLDGHGKWGTARMNISLEHFAGDNPPTNQIYLGIGDKKYQMDSRSSSMPKFTSTYSRSGNAICTAK